VVSLAFVEISWKFGTDIYYRTTSNAYRLFTAKPSLENDRFRFMTGYVENVQISFWGVRGVHGCGELNFWLIFFKILGLTFSIGCPSSRPVGSHRDEAVRKNNPTAVLGEGRWPTAGLLNFWSILFKIRDRPLA
jgi:hypothetical protein